MAKSESDIARHMAKMVAGGNAPSEIAKLFDVTEKEVQKAAEKYLSGELDKLMPIDPGGDMNRNSKYLIFNHYSGWMIMDWNIHNSRWMDQNHAQVVDEQNIIIAYELPEKPK